MSCPSARVAAGAASITVVGIIAAAVAAAAAAALVVAAILAGVVVVAVARAPTVAKLLLLRGALRGVIAVAAAKTEIGTGRCPQVLSAACLVVEVAKRLLRQAKRRRRHAFVAAALPGFSAFAHSSGKIDDRRASLRRDGKCLTP